ncbi:MAG: hypothetical protein N2560_08295 [Ignavibacteria bacterium]|nr:hypothetical protein [Ignavibacteria bacterium]
MDIISILYSILPYEILIYLRIGNSFFLNYGIYLLILGFLINLILFLNSKFYFGFAFTSRKEEPTSQENSLDVQGSRAVAVDLPKSYKFTYAYARNPRIFEKQSSEANFNVISFLEEIDRKLDDLKNQIPQKGKPESDSAHFFEDIETKIQPSKISSPGTKNRKFLNLFFNTFNIVVLILIFLFKVYGFYHYNNLFYKYFDKTKKGYELNIQKFKQIQNKQEANEVLQLYYSVDIINYKKQIFSNKRSP